jgi:hypothetical protein
LNKAVSMIKVLAMILVGALLLGCPLTKDAGDGSTGTASGDVDGGAGSDGTGGGGGTDIVQQNSSGMSDPSKCNNLPPQQMADCLEQSMGG